MKKACADAQAFNVTGRRCEARTRDKRIKSQINHSPNKSEHTQYRLQLNSYHIVLIDIYYLHYPTLLYNI